MRETFISQAHSTCEAKQKSCLSKQSLGIALAIKSTLVQFRYHFFVCVECWHLQCSRFLFDVFLLTWAPIRSARSFTLFAWRGKTGKTRLAEQLRGKQLGTGSIPIKQLLHSAEPRENLPHKGPPQRPGSQALRGKISLCASHREAKIWFKTIPPFNFFINGNF